MKFEIDTEQKTLKFENSLTVKELNEVLKKLFPDDWEEYKIEVNTTINWNPNPIIIEKWKPYTPYPWITYTNGSGDIPLLNINTSDSTSKVVDYTTAFGTYQVEYK